MILLPVLSSIALLRPELRIDDFQTPVDVISIGRDCHFDMRKVSFLRRHRPIAGSSGFVKLSIRLFFWGGSALLDFREYVSL